MSKVFFTHKSGKRERMDVKFAKILQGLKLGTYQTRDMRAADVAAPVPAAPASEPVADKPVEPQAEEPKQSKRAAKKRRKAEASKAPDEAETQCED